MSDKQKKLSELSYERFREIAQDDSLSKYEKIGFYDRFRSDYEADIFQDLLSKLPPLSAKNSVVIDIGCGCSDLPEMIIKNAALNSQDLVMIDSPEMLDKIPTKEGYSANPGQFPFLPESFFSEYKRKANVIVTYSVFHYVYNDIAYHHFVDACLNLLAPGGMFLIGDLPNVNKRNRFFSSESGVQFHRSNNNTDSNPVISHNQLHTGEIDDAAIFQIMMHARSSGFESYLLPQPKSLPMANRREDLLIVKP